MRKSIARFGGHLHAWMRALDARFRGYGGGCGEGDFLLALWHIIGSLYIETIYIFR